MELIETLHIPQIMHKRCSIETIIHEANRCVLHPTEWLANNNDSCDVMLCMMYIRLRQPVSHWSDICFFNRQRVSPKSIVVANRPRLRGTEIIRHVQVPPFDPFFY